MKVTIEQKKTELEGKKIAYVECVLYSDDGHDYRAIFDKTTKKRFNAFCVSKGFKIGVVDDLSTVPDKKIEI